MFGPKQVDCHPCGPNASERQPQAPTASERDSEKLCGVYDFFHSGGVFEVHVRSGGRFYAPNFPEKSSWTCAEQCCADGKTCRHLQIEWGKHGQYALEVDEAALPPCCSGSVKGNPAKWRKMTMKRAFTLQETKLMDSEWLLEHPGGSFPIQFHADGLNSFVCEMFPAKNAYWRIKDVDASTPTVVHIAWGRYGEYELKMAPDGESMTGSAKGLPEQWRTATRLRAVDASTRRQAIDAITAGTSKHKRDREGCGGCKKGCEGCGRE